MRIAALYDIHGNCPALEAVAREVHAAGVDHVVVGGDVLPGPMIHESLELLRQLPSPVSYLRGNGEREILALRQGASPSSIPERYRASMDWVAAALSDDDVVTIAAWPETVTITVPGGGELLFCHATPRSDSEIFTRETPETAVQPAFADVRARLVVCGHTHMQFDRAIGATRVVNAGSVGMPFAAPGAYWLLLDDDEPMHRVTSFDIDQAAARIEATAYPDARDFARQQVRRPPSEREMLERFSRVAMR